MLLNFDLIAQGLHIAWCSLFIVVNVFVSFVSWLWLVCLWVTLLWLCRSIRQVPLELLLKMRRSLLMTGTSQVKSRPTRGAGCQVSRWRRSRRRRVHLLAHLLAHLLLRHVLCQVILSQVQLRQVPLRHLLSGWERHWKTCWTLSCFFGEIKMQVHIKCCC